MTSVREWAIRELAAIEADHRFFLPPAPVQINAPLALIQVEMKARAQVLREIIERTALGPTQGETGC